MTLLLGCIADDFTGATDLAGTLVAGGMRTAQLIGVPAADMPVADLDAVVIALKSRTIAPEDAVEQSLAALDWLRAQGCRQIFFKYCSTFDSTDQGNIGPVAEALMERLCAAFAIACPAFPRNGRTVFKGYLFAGDVLLNESGMQDHPLTPMTDPNLVRVLGRQTSGRVGLISYPAVRQGTAAISEAIRQLCRDGYRFAIADATDDADLIAIGAACADHPLVTGGSGIAIGLPKNFRRAGLLAADQVPDELPAAPGAAAVISGSCSRATNAQLAHARARLPTLDIDPMALAEGRDQVAGALEWARPRLGEAPILVSATAPPERVRAVQDKLGMARAGALVEDALARIAVGLVEAGVRRLVVAGGETSGAVVRALGVTGLRIGPEIDPGVPWTATLSPPTIALALKSGNFGTEDFFSKAFDRLA